MPDDKVLPFVSVILPCWNEEHAIAECLRSVLSQTYPPDRVEILVADGRSTDRTRDIVAAIAASERPGRIRLIDNPERIQAAGCNRAITQSRGEVLVRMDAHAHYRSDYIEQCVAALERTGADNVGGAQRAIYKTVFQRALAAALKSPLGMGGASYRREASEGFVDTVWLGAFRRRVFERVGLYDSKAFTNEDADLNFRIARAGGRIFLSRDIVAHYLPRSSLRALARQYFRYGLGRARTTLKHGRLQTLRPLFPFLLVVALIGTSVLSLLHPAAISLFLAVLLPYVAVTAVESLRISLGHGLSLAPLLLPIFPAIHLGHGLGFGIGLARYTFRPDWPLHHHRLVRERGSKPVIRPAREPAREVELEENIG